MINIYYNPVTACVASLGLTISNDVDSFEFRNAWSKNIPVNSSTTKRSKTKNYWLVWWKTKTRKHLSSLRISIKDHNLKKKYKDWAVNVIHYDSIIWSEWDYARFNNSVTVEFASICDSAIRLFSPFSDELSIQES